MRTHHPRDRWERLSAAINRRWRRLASAITGNRQRSSRESERADEALQQDSDATAPKAPSLTRWEGEGGAPAPGTASNGQEAGDHADHPTHRQSR